MKKSSQRLFMMEMVLCIIILFISLSVTNLIFVRSMAQHQENEAMMKMSELMVMLSEDIQSNQSTFLVEKNRYYYFDANGNEVSQASIYRLNVSVDDHTSYSMYRLDLTNEMDEKLLSWDIVKVVK